MYIIYFDSGTTNTRVYLIKNHILIGKKQISVGSKDSAQSGGRTFLLAQLHQLYLDIITEYHLTDQDISSIYMSGMVSSPNGIIEIPHLSTPVNPSILKKNLVAFQENEVFKRKLLIIPGIKTIQPDQVINFSNIESVNNMRGEEIELLGIISSSKQVLPDTCTLVLPGSHTQIAFIDGGSITDILSTITGELFYAISKETLIGSALKTQEHWELDEEMVQQGYHCLKTYGFNRAVYIIRTMTLFLDSTADQRISFMDGVLNGGVLDAIDQKLQSAENNPISLGIAGDSLQFQIFRAITKKYFPYITTIHLNPSDGIPYSVQGLLELLN